jgi:transposase-like protein/predicted RNA-binding Zn-ribbon protein involved in translation (DUF1610 family)
MAINIAIEARQMRGQAIFKLGNQVKRIDEYSYKVNSQSGNGEYDVLSTELGWLCECPDHIYRGLKCKHLFAVEISLKLREKVSSVSLLQPIGIQNCTSCGSENIIRHGVRRNKSGDIQRYYCNSCGKWFVFNLGFERMRATPQVITSAMQLYFTGESLRNVQKFLRLQGVNKSHVAIYKWIKKYVKLMGKYLDQIKPNVSETWRADEVWIKIKGDMKYLFAMMDDETRFWIAQEVADSKFKHDARSIFRKSKERIGHKPETLITDGLPAYRDAYQKEYWTKKKENRTEHIRHIHIQKDMNNNKMERLNGEIRDREKVMRGLKRKDTPILKGYQIFHNYIREHEGLNGETPAEACGIKIEGRNKWLTIIQNASKEPTVNRDKNEPTS